MSYLQKIQLKMKNIFIIPLLLLFVKLTFGQEKMEFKVGYSELYATYDFIGKISDYYPDNSLKKEFLKSKYNTENYKQIVSQMDTLYIDFNYSFEQYPPTLKSSLASRSLLEKRLIQSKTIEEFKKKSFGIIPNEELTIFSNAVKAFLPVYNDLIFQPNKENFENQLSNINSELTTNDVPIIFNDFLKFYGTHWDFDVPFEIIANPTVGKSGIGARAFLNVSVIRFPLYFKSYDILFSVMLHEIAHIIYDNQSVEFKNDLNSWFLNTKSTYSAYAFLLLNEVLATSLGNGYAYEELKNSVDPEDWYYVKYVNSMAKEIYPLVKTYLQKGKAIDEEFVKVYVRTYDSNFSEWTKELDNILTYRVIFSDSRDNIRYFRRNYFSTYHRSGLLTKSDIEEKKQLPITKVVIVSNNHDKKLSLVKESLEEIKMFKFDSEKEFVKVFELRDRTKLILINKHNSTIETLMNVEFNERKIKTVYNNGNRCTSH